MKKYFLMAVCVMAMSVGTAGLTACGSDDDEYGDVNIPEMKMLELTGTWKGTVEDSDGKHTYIIILDGTGNVEMIDQFDGKEEIGTGKASLKDADDGCHQLFMSLKIPMGSSIASRSMAVHVKWAKTDRSAIYVGDRFLFKR